jgi:hypothetical protein
MLEVLLAIYAMLKRQRIPGMETVPAWRHDDIMPLFRPTLQIVSEKHHPANDFATVHGVVFGILTSSRALPIVAQASLAAAHSTPPSIPDRCFEKMVGARGFEPPTPSLPD